MSYYVWGSNLSYHDYLQAKTFVDDMASVSQDAGRSVCLKILRKTREVVASEEALAHENIRMTKDSTSALATEVAGSFDSVAYDLQDILLGAPEREAAFHWGFSDIMVEMGHMNDSPSQLLKIGKTPIRTVAFDHFEMARNAFRRRLFQESLEELQKAIYGDHISSGYKSEWRFHQMVGIIRLGFVDCDLSLVDLTQAEQSFLIAARYAKTDYPQDAARAFLSAGWVAYCQGKMQDVLTYTKQAISLNPLLGEALFLSAKVFVAIGQVDNALSFLSKAIDFDYFYALKAAGDGDFQKHENKLRTFLEAMRQKKYRVLVDKVQERLKEAQPWLSRNLPEDRKIPCMAFIRNFLLNQSMPLVNVIQIRKDAQTKIEELARLNDEWRKLQIRRAEVIKRVQAAMQEVMSLRNLIPASPWDEAEGLFAAILRENGNWPILQMAAKLDARESTISSVLAETKEKVFRSLEDRLKAINDRQKEQFKAIKEKYHSKRGKVYGCIAILVFIPALFSAMWFMLYSTCSGTTHQDLSTDMNLFGSFFLTLILFVITMVILSKMEFWDFIFDSVQKHYDDAESEKINAEEKEVRKISEREINSLCQQLERLQQSLPARKILDHELKSLCQLKHLQKSLSAKKR